jgi:hypothetical protein
LLPPERLDGIQSLGEPFVDNVQIPRPAFYALQRLGPVDEDQLEARNERLDDCAHGFREGHRIRVAVSSAAQGRLNAEGINCFRGFQERIVLFGATVPDEAEPDALYSLLWLHPVS